MTYTEYIDGIPVHPYAAAYPMMSEGELQDLADDIKANGQHEPIIVANLHPNLMDDPHILDGRNRYAACKLAGVEPTFQTVSLLNPEGGSGQDEVVELTDDNIRRWIDSKNLHRRHLTPEQKRERIKAALSRNPELPDYQIAKRTNTSPHTVKRVRQDNPDLQGANERVNARGQKRPATYNRVPAEVDLEVRGEVEKFTTSKGGDGKSYPASRPPRPEPAPAPGFNPGDLEELNTTTEPTKPRPEAITSQFTSAIVDLNRVLSKIDRIKNDRNFTRNKEKIAALHRHDLNRAISELQDLADNLINKSR